MNPATLVPYERNSRIHSDSQVQMICKSITEFGFLKPVLIDEMKMILAGHGAVLAAIELGLSTIPVRQITGLTDAQKRGYVIADNRSSELSKWDWEILALELDDLQSLDADLKSIGFDDFGLDKSTHHRDGHNVSLGDGRYLLQVEFETESAMQTLFEELKGRGFDNMKLLE